MAINGTIHDLAVSGTAPTNAAAGTAAMLPATAANAADKRSGAVTKGIVSVAVAALLFGAGPFPGPVRTASQAVSLSSVETAFSRQ